MKKIVLIESETAKAVEEFAARLNNAENLVDKILQAARLERTPANPDLIRSRMGYRLAALSVICTTVILITFIIFLNWR